MYHSATIRSLTRDKKKKGGPLERLRLNRKKMAVLQLCPTRFPKVTGRPCGKKKKSKVKIKVKSFKTRLPPPSPDTQTKKGKHEDRGNRACSSNPLHFQALDRGVRMRKVHQPVKKPIQGVEDLVVGLYETIIDGTRKAIHTATSGGQSEMMW